MGRAVLAALVALLDIATADARTPRRVCKSACVELVQACIASGERPRRCRRRAMRACRLGGTEACLVVPSTTTTIRVSTTTTSLLVTTTTTTGALPTTTTTITAATTTTTTTLIPTGARLDFLSTPNVADRVYYDGCNVLGQELIGTTLTITGQGDGYGDPYDVDLVGTWTGLPFRSGPALSAQAASALGSGGRWDGGLDLGTYLTVLLGYGRSPNGCDFTLVLEASRGGTPWLSPNHHPASVTFGQSCPPGYVCDGTCNCETYYSGVVDVTASP
jgi:hypothetical protein